MNQNKDLIDLVAGLLKKDRSYRRFDNSVQIDCETLSGWWRLPAIAHPAEIFNRSSTALCPLQNCVNLYFPCSRGRILQGLGWPGTSRTPFGIYHTMP